MKNADLAKETIRIGTLAPADKGAAYLKQILPHGFESFRSDVLAEARQRGRLPRLAREVRELLDGTGVVISSLGIYGNPLERTEAGSPDPEGVGSPDRQRRPLRRRPRLRLLRPPARPAD